MNALNVTLSVSVFVINFSVFLLSVSMPYFSVVFSWFPLFVTQRTHIIFSMASKARNWLSGVGPTWNYLLLLLLQYNICHSITLSAWYIFGKSLETLTDIPHYFYCLSVFLFILTIVPMALLVCILIYIKDCANGITCLYSYSY
jgi:hypothetical protein